jgi:hypothetical protein
MLYVQDKWPLYRRDDVIIQTNPHAVQVLNAVFQFLAASRHRRSGALAAFRAYSRGEGAASTGNAF